MKVLMLSGDLTIADPNSPAEQRTEDYRRVLGELEVVLCERSVFSFFSGFLYARELMSRKKFDVITAQSPEHWFFAWILSKIFGVPWQMQIHTDIFSPHFVRHSMLNKVRFLLAKFLIQRADGIRVVSERIKKSILRTKDHGLWIKISVLPIFVDIEKIKNFPVKADLRQKYPGKFIVLMASRLSREKNLVFAVEALSSLIRANKRIVLLIAGNGPEEQKLKLMTKDCGLWTNIVFEPWSEDLSSYYKTCDLFLLSSNYEGYGMTLIEAASAGAKIISSDVGIAPELLDKENIFNVGDKNGLIEKLNLAIEGKIRPAKPLPIQTKEDYLRLYKEALERCIQK